MIEIFFGLSGWLLWGYMLLAPGVFVKWVFRGFLLGFFGDIMGDFHGFKFREGLGQPRLFSRAGARDCPYVFC